MIRIAILREVLLKSLDCRPKNQRLRIATALMAACTSRAAASMLRLRSNCSVMLVEPRLLDEVISVTPAMRPNRFERRGDRGGHRLRTGAGQAGADTEIVGNSTWGNGDDR